MPAGRPTKYKKAYCDQLKDHMAQGLSYESFAGVIGVCKQTLYDWEQKHPEFLDAKKRAFAECQLWWEKNGLAGMFMGGKDEPFNATIWIFNMKNRFGWADKKEIKAEVETIPYEINDFEDPISTDDETD